MTKHDGAPSRAGVTASRGMTGHDSAPRCGRQDSVPVTEPAAGHGGGRGSRGRWRGNYHWITCPIKNVQMGIDMGVWIW